MPKKGCRFSTSAKRIVESPGYRHPRYRRCPSSTTGPLFAPAAIRTASAGPGSGPTKSWRLPRPVSHPACRAGERLVIVSHGDEARPHLGHVRRRGSEAALLLSTFGRSSQLGQIVQRLARRLLGELPRSMLMAMGGCATPAPGGPRRAPCGASAGRPRCRGRADRGADWCGRRSWRSWRRSWLLRDVGVQVERADQRHRGPARGAARVSQSPSKSGAIWLTAAPSGASRMPSSGPARSTRSTSGMRSARWRPSERCRPAWRR